MRITNNMILHNTSSNINGNKINVDTLNNQMSSQKKIQRPSDDPVIAIRALRLRNTLSEIDQYYEKNIPDAESWLDVTETALENMKNIITNIRTQCEYGASGQLTTDDRSTILSQLEKLKDQVYAEGNADYAGRTVFTGYRTNKKLTFMESETSTKYDITQKFTYSDMQEHRYYGNSVVPPTTETEVLNNTIQNPTNATYNRFRLGYGGIDSLAGQTTTTDVSVTPPVTTTSATLTYSYKDAAGTKQNDTLNVKVYDTYEDWMAATGVNAEDTKDTYAIADNEAVFIRNTGELILGSGASTTLNSRKAEFDLSYTKTGFDKGEVRPEYYYNCKNITDATNPLEYQKYDADGNEIYQDIDYVVAANQTLTVNTTASNVFDSAIGRDVNEMINAIKSAIDANQKVTDIKAMQKESQYASDDCQASLENWLAAAKKEADYANDNVQKLYNSYIGNCDNYLKDVNLALTDVGSKGQSLALTKNRMSNQQTTMETLKSNNEDRNLSDIIIDYTSAYTAYQASLQAASMINQQTLLSYL